MVVPIVPAKSVYEECNFLTPYLDLYLVAEKTQAFESEKQYQE